MSVMNFIKRIKQNKQLKKEVLEAQLKNQPLHENVMSIIYSVNTKKDVSILVLERSNLIYPWGGMKQFGAMGKKLDNDPLFEVLRITRDTITPTVDEITFQKIIRNIHTFEKVNHHLNKDLMNMNAISFLIEIEDYVLKSCVGLKNLEIKNSYAIDLKSLFELVQKNKMKSLEISKTIQPHYANLFWSRKAHLEILQKTK
jgi:hypothetical protein